MCTAYQFTPLKRGRQSLLSAPQTTFSPKNPGETRLIRPTDSAEVMLPGDEIVTMRWGFARPWSRAIVNSRDDKLAGAVWREAFATHRCLLPMIAYYEWSGPPGQKRTHLFRPCLDDLFWAAGIWEESADWGPCYSMITCSPNALVETVHDRMPALLLPEEQEAYLSGRLHSFNPPVHLLSLESDAPNPLTRKSKAPPIQGELF